MRTRTLLLDNYDSFTFNLFQLLAETNGVDPVVARNDGATWDELAGWNFDNIVVSPGPGRPDNRADFGVCADALAGATVPVLGVCLGHQGLACAAAARWSTRRRSCTAGSAPSTTTGRRCSQGIPQGFEAVRYHSLCVAPDLPDWLRPIAWTRDGVIMAVAHRDRPQWGVQFHPESICTEHGLRLLANFRDLTRNGRRRARWGGADAACVVPRRTESEWTAGDRPQLGLTVERLDRLYDTERAFVHLFGAARHAFWLDSGRADDGRARFSFMGSAEGPLGSFVSYDVDLREVTVEAHGSLTVHHETIFDHLRRELRRLRRGDDGLPFDLNGGYVGYFGYELKADTVGDAAHHSPLPDAAFIMADRLIAFDHRDKATYVLCLSDRRHELEGRRWVGETCRRLDALPPLDDPAPGDGHGRVEFRLSRSYETYLDDIRRIKDHLRDGETYEVCLTNRITTDALPDPLGLYRTVRRVNPAPFSGFLRLGDVAVLSSSPERFLSVGRDRWVEAKPIKGTTRRDRTPSRTSAWPRSCARARRTAPRT